MNKSIEGKIAGVTLSAIVASSAGFGIFGPKDGDVAVAKEDTSCMQCPGGDDLTRAERLNCINGQTDWGTIPEGSTVTVKKSEYDFTPNNGGFTRVEAENIFSLNPYTGEKIDLGERACWVDTSDLGEPQK